MAALPFPPTAIATASAAPTLVYASGATLHAYPAATSAGESSAKAHATGLIRKVALSADGTLVASAGDDKTLRIWSLGGGELVLKSTRHTLKRVACLSFTPDNDVLVTDRVGDVFLYPLEPRVAGERVQGFKEQADPSLNPDAVFLLGHVSTVSAHILAPGAKRIITADRDEHIRVSRFPKSYVIDKYVWGSEGFVSAIHVPESRPNVLVGGGGESALNIFDWTEGKLIRRVEIYPAVLNHRRFRTSPRKIKNKKRAEAAEVARKAGPAASDDPRSDGFTVAPEGMQYPVGQGVLIEKIDSVVVDGKTVIVFFSEGCTAIHSFFLPDGDEAVEIHSFPTSQPVLGFARAPGSDSTLVVTVDATYDIKKDASEEDVKDLKSAFAVLDVAADGKMTESSTQADLLDSLTSSIVSPTAPPATIAGLALYPNLGLFPRWPGFEEDEELAGPADGAKPAPSTPNFDEMAPKAIGRLKAQGVDVSKILPSRKRRKGKGGAAEAVEEPKDPKEPKAKGEGEEDALNA